MNRIRLAIIASVLRSGHESKRRSRLHAARSPAVHRTAGRAADADRGDGQAAAAVDGNIEKVSPEALMQSWFTFDPKIAERFQDMFVTMAGLGGGRHKRPKDKK
jgi:hypothetical protein